MNFYEKTGLTVDMSIEYIEIDAKDVKDPIDSIVKNRAILAFAYKLMDNFPNITLFGSIVREIIAPCLIKSTYPFANNFKSDYDLSDIDIIYNLEIDSEKEKWMKEHKSKKIDLLRDELEKIRPKFREWDWWIEREEKLEVYGVKGIRYHVSNLILDFSIHIDFVIEDSRYIIDFNVNRLRFNKNKGLFSTSEEDNNTIISQFKTGYEFQNLLKCIEKRECTSVFDLCKTFGNEQDNLDIGRNILFIKRYIKMLKNCWIVKNQSKYIKLHKYTNNEHICFEIPSAIHVELTCSKCILCLECFESLMKNMNFTSCTFKCPTCKKPISLLSN